jgi:hypothetical protein
MESQQEHSESSFDRMRRRDSVYRAGGYKTARRFRKRKSPTPVAGMQNRRNKHWAW